MKYDIVKVKITEKCNRDCSFCVFHDSLNEMDEEEFRKIINIVKNIDFDAFHINGGEPLTHPDFVLLTEIAKKKFPNKKFVLGTNGILMGKEKIAKCIANNYDEICIGCDDEHKNIDYLEKNIPKVLEYSNVLFIINSLNQYISEELSNRLLELKNKYPENIILVRNDVHHLESDYRVHKLPGLCKQDGKNVIMIDEHGNVYRCFNSKVPDDIEFNIFDENVLELVNRKRDFHYKYCPFCPLYDDGKKKKDK